jgi:hypothetical protein
MERWPVNLFRPWRKESHRRQPVNPFRPRRKASHRSQPNAAPRAPRAPAHGSSARRVFARPGFTQSPGVSLLPLVAKIDGRCKGSQPLSQLQFPYGRNKRSGHSNPTTKASDGSVKPRRPAGRPQPGGSYPSGAASRQTARNDRRSANLAFDRPPTARSALRRPTAEA